MVKYFINVFENLNMNRRRVVHVLSSSGFAGAEKVVSDIVNNLSSKFDFLVISYLNKDLREFIKAKMSVGRIFGVVKLKNFV